MRNWLLPLPVLLALSPTSLDAQGTEPVVSVCRAFHDAASGQTRYRVEVDWNGFDGGGYERLDVAAFDAADVWWPQFRDGRMRPHRSAFRDYITVSGATRYPLQIQLVGFRDGAIQRFDTACRNGLCSLPEGADGFTAIGAAANVNSPEGLRECNGRPEHLER
jgi:hypothetical protein